MSMIVGDFSPVTCTCGLKNLPLVFTKLKDRVFSSIRGKFVDFFLIKILLCKKTVQYLGYMISKDRITTTEENIEKMKNFTKPKRVKDVKSFIGRTTFYQKKLSLGSRIGQKSKSN